MTEMVEQASVWLDRPVSRWARVSRWTVAYLALMLFVVLTRLWAPGARAYSHDESIHAWEAWKLVTGQGYTHNPVYHGPFLYHLTALFFLLFGHNDVTARLGVTLLGIGITVMPLFLRRWLGKGGVLATTFLMAISPVLMHRSRFLRHDQGAVLFNLILFVALLNYIERPKDKWLYVVAASVALGFAAKETTFITYFVFGTFLVGLLLWQWWQGSNRTLRALVDIPTFDLIVVMGTLILPLATPFPIKLLGHDPVDYSQSAIFFSGAVFLVMFGIAAAIGLWWDWRRWLVSAGIYYAIFVPLFTTMFTNGQGIATGMVGQLGYWLSQQEVKRGGQPFYYYLVLLPLYEFLSIGLGLGGVVHLIRTSLLGAKEVGESPGAEPALTKPQADDTRRSAPFVLWVLYWLVLALLLYSWAGEKMPWLVQHIAVPLHLLAGWTLAKLAGANWAEIWAQRGAWLLFLVPLFLYALARLVGAQAFQGTSTEALGQTMGWLASLLVAIILGAGIYWIGGSLRATDMWRLAALSVVIVLAALTVRVAWMATFIHPDSVTEFLVYAQGAPDCALVADEIEQMSRRLTGGLHMKVAYDDDTSWPFVWYLRDYDNAQFYGKKPAGPFDAEVVLVGPPNEAGIKPMLGNNYYRRQYRLIWWPNQDWYMDLSPKKLWTDVRDPDARQKFWDVVFYRKHEASVTSWPFVHNFAMYVRRDVARQLWDYGTEALASLEPLPGDEYIERWEQRQALAAWGSQGSGQGQFSAPKGVALDVQGNVYVTDSQNNRVQVLAPDGTFLREWGSEGSGPGQLKEPWGIGVSPEGEVFVADTWNHRIQVFDAQGAHLRSWGAFGEVSSVTGDGVSLYGPRDIAFDRVGNLFVSDTGNKRIVKYDQTGALLAAVGGPGDAASQFQEPVGLAIDAEDQLYVADTWNKRIQVFDTDLRFLRQWPVHTWEGMSVVNKPYLAVDGQGHVLVTDPEGYRIIEFDADGQVVRTWGQMGSDYASMNLPTGIVVDAQGRVLVADAENNRILVFAP